MNIAVIGLGNVLLGDDGFGPYVVELLRTRYNFPSEVELLDLGTPGLGLIGYLHGRDAVVIVDAVAGGTTPGIVRVYEGDEIERMVPGPRVSPHDPAVAEALCVVRAAGGAPCEACVVGVVPGSLEPGAGISAPVRTAAELAATIVRRRIEQLGIHVHPRSNARVEPDWWRGVRPQASCNRRAD